jgi:hypothetical protein
MKTTSQTVLGAILAAVLALQGAAAAQGDNTSQAQSTDKAKMAVDRNSKTTKLPSDQDIENAKSEGLVWANQSNKVYHRDGESYGKTKRGKFMTEDDARKAGFHQAKEPIPSGKSASKKPGDQSGIDSTIGTHASAPAKP